MLSREQATAQSLDTGAAGIALLAIERATDDQDWSRADRLIRQAAGTVDTSEHTSLYYGTPAVAYVLNIAAEQHSRYQAAANTLVNQAGRIAHRRVEKAHARLTHGVPARFGDYDLFRGLVGHGALLLRAVPGHDALARVLSYLVELTAPRRDSIGRTRIPGWFVEHDPDRLLPTPGGHLNFGMAHGAAGILALLALAARFGIRVAGQDEAIHRLVGWYEAWQQDGPSGPWWPQWLTRTELDTGRLHQPRPGRDSWCYGAVGIARALQLAAIATGDPQRQARAEHALAACLTPTRLVALDGAGLCHGLAGVYQTAVRASADDTTGDIGERLPDIADLFTTTAAAKPVRETGLLTGRLGIDLARHQPTRTGWDTCLLIT